MTRQLPTLLLFLPAAALGQDLSLDTDVAKVLSRLPGVESVEVRHAVDEPKHRIIHILNFHYVDKEDYAADLLDEDSKTTQKEIDENYALLVAIVKDVQAEQTAILDFLTEKHGLKHIYLEGVTERNAEVVEANLRNMTVLKKLLEQLKASGIDIEDQEKQQEESLLRVGAAAQPSMDGRLKVRPAERHEAYEAANPVKPDGTFELDEKKQQDREDAIVKSLLKDEVAVVILGNAHDLTDNVKRLAPDCEYVVVRVKSLPESD